MCPLGCLSCKHPVLIQEYFRAKILATKFLAKNSKQAFSLMACYHWFRVWVIVSAVLTCYHDAPTHPSAPKGCRAGAPAWPEALEGCLPLSQELQYSSVITATGGEGGAVSHWKCYGRSRTTCYLKLHARRYLII